MRAGRRLPPARGRGPDGPAPLAGQFYMLAASEGWGVAGARRAALSGARVLRLPGARTAARLPAGGDRPGHRVPRGAGAGRRRYGWSARSASASRSPRCGRRAPPLLVGGGIGTAPLVIWAEALARAGGRPAALLGFRSAAYAAAAELFDGDAAARDRRRLCAGRHSVHHGFVTELLERGAGRRPGGRVRLRAAGDARGGAAHLRRARRAGQLAMEAGMACGFGACFGCVVRTRDGYRRLCVDGPVVDAADLEEGSTDGARRGSERRAGRRAARHPVLNGSGTFDAIAALRTFGAGAARGLSLLRVRLEDDHARAAGRQSAAAAVGDARPA